MLAYSAEAWFDLVTPAPGLETSAPELTAFVANKMLRPGFLGGHRPTEERTHGFRCGFLAKHGTSHHTAGEMIDRDGHPPAERPARRQGKWKPRTLIASSRGNRCQINIPHVIRVFGRDYARRGFVFFH